MPRLGQFLNVWEHRPQIKYTTPPTDLDSKHHLTPNLHGISLSRQRLPLCRPPTPFPCHPPPSPPPLFPEIKTARSDCGVHVRGVVLCKLSCYLLYVIWQRTGPGIPKHDLLDSNKHFGCWPEYPINDKAFFINDVRGSSLGELLLYYPACIWIYLRLICSSVPTLGWTSTGTLDTFVETPKFNLFETWS